MINEPANAQESQLAQVRAVIDPGAPALVAFDYLLALASAAAFVPVPRSHGAVLSVELQLPDRQRNPFSAQAHPRHINFYLRRPILVEHPGLFSAAEARFGPITQNRLGEYRTHLHNSDDVDALLDFLRKEGAWPSHRHDKRYAASTFRTISGEHLLRAARRLADGDQDHRFGLSTAYDVLFDGQRLPPKALFGLAAADALAIPVRPENFNAGEGTICFRILRDHGYPVIAKRDHAEGDTGLSHDDRAWSEGDQRLVQHLKRERATGLAAAKRASFRREHGRLFCEQCGMDPVVVYGKMLGEACIEVHHRAVQIADMHSGHRTQLADLMCLCANCHRLIHAELRAALTSDTMSG